MVCSVYETLTKLTLCLSANFWSKRFVIKNMGVLAWMCCRRSKIFFHCDLGRSWKMLLYFCFAIVKICHQQQPQVVLVQTFGYFHSVSCSSVRLFRAVGGRAVHPGGALAAWGRGFPLSFSVLSVSGGRRQCAGAAPATSDRVWRLSWRLEEGGSTEGVQLHTTLGEYRDSLRLEPGSYSLSSGGPANFLVMGIDC